MNAFNVWVRPLGYEYLVGVDGEDNARWLLDQLAKSFVFRSALPIENDDLSALCTFQVPCNAQLSLGALLKLLKAIPGVTLVAATPAN